MDFVGKLFGTHTNVVLISIDIRTKLCPNDLKAFGYFSLQFSAATADNIEEKHLIISNKLNCHLENRNYIKKT